MFRGRETDGFEAVEVPVPYYYPHKPPGRLLANAGLQLVPINSPGRSRVSHGVRNGVQSRAGRKVPRRRPPGAGVRHRPQRPVYPSDGGGRARLGQARGRQATYLENLAWAADQAAQTDVTLLVEVINQQDVPGFVLRSQQQPSTPSKGSAAPERG